MSEPPADQPPPEGPGPRHRLDPDRAAGHPLDPDRAPATPGHQLDPDQAAAEAGRAPGRPTPPVIDTRRYQWMIGIFGLALVIVISVSFLTTHTIGPPGVAAGNRLHHFAAPLAGSTLEGDANLKPPCSAAHHDPRALNTCLLVSRAPLVLAFFTTNSGTCIQQVDTLQTVSRQFPGRAVQFAAVAVRASHRKAAALVRSHRWTIPVAYDRDGAVGALYGVEVCPMLELAHRGGVVAARLFGSHWLGRAALSARVQALVGG